jgi:hypothetical protein
MQHLMRQLTGVFDGTSERRKNKISAPGIARFSIMKRDTLCDTLVLGVLRAYKDLGSHRGLVSC